MPYSRYYRYKLNDSQKKLYDALLRGYENRKSSVNVLGWYETEEIQKVSHALNFDYPGLFYVDFGHIQIAKSAVSCTVYLSYCMDEAVTAACNRKIDAVVASLQKMVAGKPMRDAALLLHDWLVKNCAYGESSDTARSAHSIVGALIDRVCVCEGYAKAYKHLADAIRLRCIIVTGKGIEPNGPQVGHGWNIVKLDTGCYHVDVTFDLLFAGNYCSRAYFLLSTGEILLDHSLDPAFEMPDCPNSGSLLPIVGGTRQLIAFLESEYRRGAACSEVRLTKGFTGEKLMSMIRDKMSARDILWYNHIRHYVYGDYSRSLFICWK